MGSSLWCSGNFIAQEHANGNKRTNYVDSERGDQVFFQLPASTVWTKTNITIPNGEKIYFSASGLIHLDLKRLTRSLEDYHQPKDRWTDYVGLPVNSEMARERVRKSLLNDSNANLGAIIGFLKPVGASEEPSLEHPRIGKTFNVSKVIEDNSYIESEEESVLYLIVNDYILDENSRYAYVAKDNEKEYKEDPIEAANWEKLLEGKFWNIYFDDNMEAFLIKIRGEVKYFNILTAKEKGSLVMRALAFSVGSELVPRTGIEPVIHP